MTKRQFLLQYLSVNKHTSSWDWEADVEYAKQFYKDIEVGDDLLKSFAPSSIKIAVHQQYLGKVKADRLTQLRKLVKEGLVKARWDGLGYGARSTFGISKN